MEEVNGKESFGGNYAPMGSCEEELQELQMEMAAMEKCIMDAQKCMESLKKRISGVQAHIRMTGKAGCECLAAHQACFQDENGNEGQNIGKHDGLSFDKYPIIGEMQTEFFLKAHLPVDASWILHTIFDFTQKDAWNPERNSAVGRWKILYFTLYKMKYFKLGDRPRYKAFARAIVKYCYPKVDAEKYANNLSKNKIGGSMMDWTHREMELFRQLKEALSFSEE